MSTVIDHSPAHDGEAKNHALVAYVLLGFGLFTAIPILFAAIWAMIKRKHALGTVYHSHYTNTIRVFWWTVLWSIIGGILFVVGGWLIWCVLWFWALYRLINGSAKILADAPYPL